MCCVVIESDNRRSSYILLGAETGRTEAKAPEAVDTVPPQAVDTAQLYLLQTEVTTLTQRKAKMKAELEVLQRKVDLSQQRTDEEVEAVGTAVQTEAFTRLSSEVELIKTANERELSRLCRTRREWEERCTLPQCSTEVELLERKNALEELVASYKTRIHGEKKTLQAARDMFGFYKSQISRMPAASLSPKPCPSYINPDDI